MYQLPIRVLVADDHPIVVDGILATLRTVPQLQVIGVAHTAAELFTHLPNVSIDVLVLDIGGMGSSPITVVTRLQREYPRTAIVVFSSSIDLAPELIQAGVRGYVVKEELAQLLIEAIVAVHAGHTMLSPAVQEYLAQTQTSHEAPRLVPQEIHVLKLLAQGATTLAIAEHLAIDPRTVQNYITTLRRKTGCQDRLQLVQWYQRLYG